MNDFYGIIILLETLIHQENYHAIWFRLFLDVMYFKLFKLKF
jgi:hypothetical protein